MRNPVELTNNAVLVSSEAFPRAIGHGSVVERRRSGTSSLGVPHEVEVAYVDGAGRHHVGWLSSKATYRSVPVRTPLRYVAADPTEGFKPWDRVRSRLAAHGMQSLEKVVTPVELVAVIREFGGNVKSTDDHITILRRFSRLVLHKELDMNATQVESAKPAAKSGSKKSAKAAKKGSAKKAEAAEKTPRGGAAIGETLVKLLPKGGARKLARTLADGGELSKKQLGELQEGVNEAATAAREAEDGSLASKLSGANRIVRRMRRSA